jgi:hypothetical protein
MIPAYNPYAYLKFFKDLIISLEFKNPEVEFIINLFLQSIIYLKVSKGWRNTVDNTELNKISYVFWKIIKTRLELSI